MDNLIREMRLTGIALKHDFFRVLRFIRSIPARIRQSWYRLWIRKDEFHRSLDLDADYLMYLDDEQRSEYLKDLVRRREIAHQRDLNRS